MFTPTTRSLTLLVQSPAALMSFAFSRSFMESSLCLKHMVSYTLPTHVTSDRHCTPQHVVVNVGFSPFVLEDTNCSSSLKSFCQLTKFINQRWYPCVTCFNGHKIQVHASVPQSLNQELFTVSVGQTCDTSLIPVSDVLERGY